MKLRYLDKARDDLDAIYFHIAMDNEPAAARVIERLQRAVQRLPDFPRSAPDRSELGEGIRGLAAAGYVAFYRIDPDAVVILRIIHSARDIATVDLN